jgi:hypothetical protein
VAGVRGQVTPFLLAAVAEETQGESDKHRAVAPKRPVAASARTAEREITRLTF